MGVERVIESGELFLDGNKLPSKGKFELKFKHGKRETIEDHKEIHGYTEKTEFPTIKGKIIFKSKDVFDTVEKAVDATVALKGDNEKTYVLTGAIRVGSMGNVSIGDGAAYDVEFKGNDLIEQ